MNIATYMMAYAKLSPSGRNYVCSCPFHETNTQSMKLMPSADWFECTECEREGNLADLRKLIWEHSRVLYIKWDKPKCTVCFIICQI